MSSSQSRHVYTREQRTILEASFTRQSYPDINEKERLAKLLNCNLIQISNWFQNHRRRIKKSNIPIQPSDCPFINNNEHSYYYCYHPPSEYVYYYPQQSYNQTVPSVNY